jgi:hypothetical protein
MPLEQIRTLLNDSAAFDKFVEEHAHTKYVVQDSSAHWLNFRRFL